jgi:chemotaxis protein CheZ
MAAQRKQFRVETLHRTDPRGPSPAEGAPLHHEMMRELKALRALVQGQQPQTEEQAEKQTETEILRAKLNEAQKLKTELDIIYGAIHRTKQELAQIHLGTNQAPDTTRVAQELDAVIGGTEQATEAILKAAEGIDEAASSLAASLKNAHEMQLAQDIQDRVVAIFEACNFQDLSGQRITKAMRSMRFIEQHILRMMEIWGGIEAISPLAAEAPAEPNGHAHLLNGPKLETDAGHASQNDIDALFN